MSRNACNGENGETGEKLPAAGDLNWKPKVAPVGRAIPSEKLALELLGIPVVLNSAYNLSILLVEIKFSIRMLTNKILMNLLQPWNRQSQAKWCR